MGDAQPGKPVGKHPRSRMPSLIPIPVDERHQGGQFPMQRWSWWQLCTQWLRYQSIQLRWDIERSLARLFHRRWGS